MGANPAGDGGGGGGGGGALLKKEFPWTWLPYGKHDFFGWVNRWMMSFTSWLLHVTIMTKCLAKEILCLGLEFDGPVVVAALPLWLSVIRASICECQFY